MKIVTRLYSLYPLLPLLSVIKSNLVPGAISIIPLYIFLYVVITVGRMENYALSLSL